MKWKTAVFRQFLLAIIAVFEHFKVSAIASVLDRQNNAFADEKDIVYAPNPEREDDRIDENKRRSSKIFTKSNEKNYPNSLNQTNLNATMNAHKITLNFTENGPIKRLGIWLINNPECSIEKGFARQVIVLIGDEQFRRMNTIRIGIDWILSRNAWLNQKNGQIFPSDKLHFRLFYRNKFQNEDINADFTGKNELAEKFTNGPNRIVNVDWSSETGQSEFINSTDESMATAMVCVGVEINQKSDEMMQIEVKRGQNELVEIHFDQSNETGEQQQQQQDDDVSSAVSTITTAEGSPKRDLCKKIFARK